MKVGIYTFHKETNYGAVLQAYATQYIIRSFGVETEIVNYYPREKEKRNSYIGKNDSLKSIIKNIYAVVNPMMWTKSKRFSEFHEMMSLSRRYETIDEIYQNPPVYDVHLVGSDQVWNLERGFSKRAFFFLDFLKRDEKRISYASSFGNADISSSTYPRLKDLLSKFSAISVREDSGVKLIEKATGLHAEHVLDPTLLLTRAQWQELSSDNPVVSGDYILYYGFDKDDTCRQMINMLCTTLRMPIIAVSVSPTIPYKVDKLIQSAGPKEFVNLFLNANYVITSSFHGVAFALNFQKDFVVMKHGTRMSRMESLLDMVSLKNRIVSSVPEMETLLENEIHVDYSVSYEGLERNRRFSIDWLKTSLYKN